MKQPQPKAAMLHLSEKRLCQLTIKKFKWIAQTLLEQMLKYKKPNQINRRYKETR